MAASWRDTPQVCQEFLFNLEACKPCVARTPRREEPCQEVKNVNDSPDSDPHFPTFSTAGAGHTKPGCLLFLKIQPISGGSMWKAKLGEELLPLCLWQAKAKLRTLYLKLSRRAEEGGGRLDGGCAGLCMGWGDLDTLGVLYLWAVCLVTFQCYLFPKLRTKLSQSESKAKGISSQQSRC